MTRKDLYSQITDRLKCKLESGTLPWRKSWRTGLPVNYASKKLYNGINFLSLSLNDFGSPYYLTYLQCKEKGGSVNAGAKGSLIIYWDIKTVEDRYNPGELKNVPLIQHSYAFNLEQTNLNPMEPTASIIECEKLISNYNIEIRHNIRSSYYNSVQDVISLPQIQDFDSSEEYWATLFHEIIHSTGHPMRLATYSTANDNRAYEELVAEIGSAYLCGMAGIEVRVLDNQAAYIDSWLKESKEDYFIRAAADAKRAVDFILRQEGSASVQE